MKLPVYYRAVFIFTGMEQNRPIGIFDSGVGGTSIWKEIHQLLPFEDTIFLADSKNAPYGNKSAEEILQLSIKNTERLLEMGCKIIVVACNTATTNAILALRENYNIPFIGIEPAIKPAALQTASKSIGILATKGTLSSALFHQTSSTLAKNISVVEIIGEGLVQLIEAGEIESAAMTELLKKYVSPMLAAKVDYIVLGCTHYPYIIPTLRKLIPKDIKIIESGEAVARQTKNVLRENTLLNDSAEIPNLQFLSNANSKTLRFLLKSYEKEISVNQIDF